MTRCGQQEVDKYREECHVETHFRSDQGKDPVGHSLGNVHDSHCESRYEVPDKVLLDVIPWQPLCDGNQTVQDGDQ